MLGSAVNATVYLLGITINDYYQIQEEVFSTREAAEQFGNATIDKEWECYVNELVRSTNNEHTDWKKRKTLFEAGLGPAPGDEPVIYTLEEALASFGRPRYWTARNNFDVIETVPR